MPINTAPSVTEKDIKSLVKSLNSLAERINQIPTEGGKTFNNTAPTRKPVDSDKRAKEAEKIMRSAIKPTIGPFAKIMGRFVESAFGRAMIHWVGTTKSYFSNFANQASSLMNKAFGQFLDDLQPIIQTLKTSVNFLYDVILKPIAKLFSGIAKWGWNKITDAFGSIKDKFSIKKKPEEIVAKAVVRQVDYLKRIDLNTRRIERNTRKEGSAYRRAHLGALLMGMGNRTPKQTSTPNIIPKTGGILGSLFGGIFGGIGTVIGGAASLIRIFMGPILGTLVTMGIGAIILKGLWDMFKDTEVGKWFDEKIATPVINWFKGPFLDTMIDIAGKVGGAIIDAIKRNYFGGKEEEAARKIEKDERKLRSKADEAKTPEEKAKWTMKADAAKNKAEKIRVYGKNRTDNTWTATKWGSGIGFAAAAGSLAGLATIGVTAPIWATALAILAAAGAVGYTGYKIADYIGESNSPINEKPTLNENDRQQGGFGTGIRPEILNTVDNLLGKVNDKLDNWVTKNTAPPLNSVTIPIPLASQNNYPGYVAKPASYKDIKQFIGMVESSSGKHLENPDSTATGRYQIIEGTWNAIVDQLRTKNAAAGLEKVTPANARIKGKDPRYDPKQIERVQNALIDEYTKDMSTLGIGYDTSFYQLYQLLGTEKAHAALADWKAGNNKTPMGKFMDKKARDANPTYVNTTVPNALAYFRTKNKNMLGNAEPSLAEKIGGGLQSLAEYVAESADLTPEEMHTLFNPAPRSSVEAADRERAQNKMFLERGEWKPAETTGSPTLINNNVANSSNGERYGEAPRIFDSVFPQFEWVLANH